MSEIRVVHEQDDTLGDSDDSNRRVLATDVDIADSVLSTARGLMFRAEIPEEYALVMEVGGNTLPFFEGPPRQFVHMLFVRMPLDVLWLDGEEVVRVSRMHPWRSFGLARADRILELPAGNADGVREGDTVRILDGDGEAV